MTEQKTMAIDRLISSLEEGTYNAKHIEALLAFLFESETNGDNTTSETIIKVLGYCTNPVIREPIVKAIEESDSGSDLKTKLITICWESGLDFSPWLTVFVYALLDKNEMAAIEAYTLICECTVAPKNMQQVMELLCKSDQTLYSKSQQILINDALNYLIELYNTKKTKP